MDLSSASHCITATDLGYFWRPLSLALLGDSPALSHVHGLPHVASDINKKKETKNATLYAAELPPAIRLINATGTALFLQ